MKKKRKQFIKLVENVLGCELVEANANLLHFKTKTDDCPSIADIESVLPELTLLRRHHNILLERPNPKPYDVSFIFAGMINIPVYLIKTFGGHSPKPYIWHLHNMSMYETDQRGYRSVVAPDVEEIKDHIYTIYQLLNPNCKRRDIHKRKMKLLSYNSEINMWECGSQDYLSTVFVEAPEYLSKDSCIYVNSYKKCFESYGKTYEYYGKGLCKEVKNNDYAMLFAVKPDAIYDWFYSAQRDVSEIESLFHTIEASYKNRPWMYYCKGEYTKLRNLFLMETLRWLLGQPNLTIRGFSYKLRRALSAVCAHLTCSMFYQKINDNVE